MALTENVIETVTPEGAVVLSEELPHVASVTLGVWISAGSRHELEGEDGLTHFLEHMLFKGTSRRTARQIAEELDAVGGHLDAATSRETTCFLSRVMSQHLPLACDVIGDILTGSLFREADVDRERSVVLEEIRSYEDEPAELAMDQMMRTFYGDHPLARPILGSRKVMEKIDSAAVAGHRNRLFGRDRVVVAAAGQVRHDDLVSMVEPLLAGLPSTGEPRPMSPPVPNARQAVTTRSQEQVHMVLAAPTFPFSCSGRHVLQVLNNLLGGSMSSRLFQEIREKRGLAYGVSSGADSFHDAGILSIHTAADPDSYAEIASVIGDILDDLSSGGVRDEEVLRAREQIKGNIFLALESTSARMSRMALSKIYLDRVTPLEEVMAMVDAVTPEAVREMARRILAPAKFSLAALGPGESERYRVPWGAGLDRRGGGRTADEGGGRTADEGEASAIGREAAA
jgi:predicted Zn-dependent peptidase